MNKQLYPTDLTDSQWEYIRDLIPPAKPGGRPRSLDMRQIVNGLVYLVVGGIQWRMLPTDYPPWKSVYHYFRRWRDDGTWQRIHDTLRATVRRKAGRHPHPTAGCLASQRVKTTAIRGVRGYDAGKKVCGRKRHIVVDTMGLLVAATITAASIHDRDGAKLVLSRLRGACKNLRRMGVDGGYRGQVRVWVAAHCRYQLTVVLRTDDQKGFVVVPRRWVVERTFAWLNHNRRLSKDYEGCTTTSESMIYRAMIRLMLRRLSRV